MNMYKKIRNIFGFLVLAAFVVGCANQSPTTTKTNQGRYKVTKDYGPDSVVDVSHVQDAIPKVEPLSRGGNRNNYEVLGKSYQVMASAKGYQESGGASWYGKKFHGYLTANGEKYDMYGMTAAHKSLPIPTYVQVTNLANNNKVVGRVNDRGPFHKGRIIDLSYAAAAKLGMLSNGTGQVLVESIDPTTWGGNKTAGNDLVIKKPVETQVGPKYLKASFKKPTVVDNLQVESMSLTPTKVTTAAITADVPEVKKAPVTSKKAPRSDK
jgi:rare lipoprotein A